MRLLNRQLPYRDFLRTAVNAGVSQIAQPHTHLGVGGVGIQAQPLLCELTCQSVIKTTPQIAVKALDLALGFGAVGLAQADNETVMAGKI